MISKPEAGEFAPFYAGYIDTVPEAGPLTALEAQRDVMAALGALDEDRAAFRYAEGKWSVKEVLGHVADAERVFAYRLLRIARGDTTPMAGFDEGRWMAASPHHYRSIADLTSELLAVREATLALVGSLDGPALMRTGVANDKPVSARALCWILAGHAEHHLGILKQRYGV